MSDKNRDWSRRNLLRTGSVAAISSQAGCLRLVGQEGSEDSTDRPEETAPSSSESASPASTQWLVGADPANTGVISYVEPITGVDGTVWRFQPQNGGYAVRGGPTVTDESVFVGTNDRRLYSLARSSGETRWAANIDFPGRATPAVTSETVYTTGYDTLYAFDRASGDLRWDVELARIAGGTPVVADDTVVIGSRKGIYGIDASSGGEQWITETDLRFDESTAIADGDIYLINRDGVLQALHQDGDQSWQVPFDRTDVAPVLDSERVYVAIDSWNGENEASLAAVDRDTGDIRWKFEDGNRASAPAVYNETVYVWVRDGASSYVYALNSESGERRWRRAYDSRVMNAINATDGAVYVGDREGGLTQFDSTSGEIKWSSSLDGPIRSRLGLEANQLYVGTDGGFTAALPLGGDAPIWTHETLSQFSRPAAVDGMVYVGSTDQTVYALDPEHGKPMWTTGVDSQVTAAPAVHGELLIVATRNGTVYGFDRTNGETEWSNQSADAYHAAPTIVEDTVYIGGSLTGLHAIDATEGVENWSVELEGRVSSTPAVADGRVFVTADETGVVALDAATGDSQWAKSSGAPFEVSPVVADKNVYACTSEGTIFAFDPEDGASEQVFEGGERIRTTPAIFDGKMYVGLGPDLFAVDLKRGVPIWEAEGDNGSITSSPTVTGETVYVGQVGQVSAHATGSGERQWSVDFDSWVNTQPTPSDYGVFVGGDGLYRIQ